MSLDVSLYETMLCDECSGTGVSEQPCSLCGGPRCIECYGTGFYSDCVYDANITHNLNRMAAAAGFYKQLWRPEEVGITRAAELIEPLRKGIAELESDPDKYREFDACNGWGTYDDFVPWLKRYLSACEQYPTATLSVSR